MQHLCSRFELHVCMYFSCPPRQPGDMRGVIVVVHFHVVFSFHCAAACLHKGRVLFCACLHTLFSCRFVPLKCTILVVLFFNGKLCILSVFIGDPVCNEVYMYVM